MTSRLLLAEHREMTSFGENKTLRYPAQNVLRFRKPSHRDNPGCDLEDQLHCLKNLYFRQDIHPLDLVELAIVFDSSNCHF